MVVFRMKRNIRNVLIFLFFIFVSFYYIKNAYTNAFNINTFLENPSKYCRSDQCAYLNYAISLKKSERPLEDRNRMPIYPFLLSLITNVNESLLIFSIKARILNILISYLCLVALYFIFTKYLPIFASINLTIITAFTAFIYRAGYVQPEILYYTFFFISFLLTAKFFAKPKLITAVLTGIFIAITQLTKAAALPIIIFSIIVFLFKQLYLIYKNNKHRIFKSSNLYFFVLILAFLITMGPYIVESKKKFGYFFYNVDYIYIWYDSWSDCLKGSRSAGDTQHFPNLPQELVPGPVKYLKTHSPIQLANRINNGLQETLSNWVIKEPQSYGYHYFFLVFLFFTIVNIAISFKQFKQLILEYFWTCLFIFIMFAGYILLIGLYGAITTGNRYILALFIPSMFSISFLNYRLALKSKKTKIYRIFNILLFTAIMIWSTTILNWKINIIDGGD